MLLLDFAVSIVVFNEDVCLFYIFQILGFVGTGKFIQVFVVMTMVFVFIFYLALILGLYLLSFVRVIAVVVIIFLAFLPSIVMMIPASSLMLTMRSVPRFSGWS